MLSGGRRRIDIIREVPGGAVQVLPLRPRPWVWRSATMTSPSLPPLRALSSNTVLVDEISGTQVTS